MNKLFLSFLSLSILIAFSIFFYFALISGEMYIYINLIGVIIFSGLLYLLKKNDSDEIIPFYIKDNGIEKN